MNGKYLFRIVAIVAVAGLFFACKNKNIKNEKTTQEQPAAVFPAPAESGTNIKHDSKNAGYFVFEGYGARMAIPQKWMDCVAFTKSPKNEDGASAEYVATFTGSKGTENQFLGAVYVFTKPQWAAVSPEWKGAYTKIGEVGDNLYYYKSNQSNPYGNDTDIGKEFDAHFITMPDASKVLVIEKLLP